MAVHHRLTASGGVGLLLAAVLASSAHAAPVGLGAADSYAVLGGSTVTNTGPSVISGDLGLSPGSAVIGFPPGIVVNGTIHAADAAAGQAKNALTTAYNDAAARPSTSTVAGDLAGRRLTPGVYSSASSLGLSGDLTLDAQNDPNAVFVFQAGSTLTTGSGSRVLLTGGARACNVFWQVGSSAVIGSSTAFTGSILALTSISLVTGATIEGRALARNGAVTLDTNRITRSSCAAGTPSDGPGANTAPTGVAPGAPGSPGTPSAGSPRRSPARAPSRRGTARPLQGPTACVTKAFTVRVTGRRIRQVAFALDGEPLGTVNAKPGRTVFAMRVEPGAGASRITARVRFKATSRTRAKTLRLTFQRCGPTRGARFTG